MKLVEKILNRCNGLHFRQEYLCIAKEILTRPLHVYLVHHKRVIKDITNKHLFVGYSPLVFAFTGIEFNETIQLIFTHQLLQPNEIFVKKDALARMDLKKIQRQPSGSNNIFYFEGIRGVHKFQSLLHQFINAINNRLLNKKAGNVFLHNNLYKQVQIAYAVPRIISLITVGNDNLFNLFPTDLHGEVDQEYYIISLRTGGNACKQAEAAGKLLITQVDSALYKTVYALGKNHMQELKTSDSFPFSALLSVKFRWPVPLQALSYKELIFLESFTHGIHKILLFKIVTNQQIAPQTTTLAHIHNSYASWRYKNNLPGNYLLR
jgi:hypothetical protein